MGFYTMELDGRALEVLDGSLPEVAACVYGITRSYLTHVHEGDGKPIYDGRSPYHPLIRLATIAEIRRFEARQRQLVDEGWIDKDALDMDELFRGGCRGHTLIEVFDMPDDDEMVL